MTHNLIPQKIKTIYILGFIMTVMLMLFAFRWQVVEAARFADEIRQRKREYLIPSIRGAILANDGSTLAYSEPRFDLFVYIPEIQYAELKELQTRSELLNKIVGYTKYEVDDLEQLFTDMSKQYIAWFKVAEGLSLTQKLELESLKREYDEGRMEGLTLIYNQKRFYPEGQLAAHVVGFADSMDDGGMVGRGGLEGEWNGNLEPQRGYVSYDIDAAGNPVTGSTAATIQAKRGNTIVTSIDKYLQFRLEQRIKEGVEQFKASSGTALVMDPKTGHILAMANYPSFDLNTRKVDDPNVFGNSAVSQPYEVGSVGKVFTLAAAIDSKTFKAQDTVIKGHTGCEALIEGFRVCNLFEKASGPLSLMQATVKSDNVAYYHIAQKVTGETLYDYLKKFGVGHPSGIDLSGESYGIIKDRGTWNENDLSAYSYGTSYQVNTVQTIAAVGSVANYGVRMQPMLVTKVIDADGAEIDFEPKVVERVISDNSSVTTAKVMNEVFKSNIWDYTHLHSAPIAMKSGTALIVKNGVYSEDYNATYIGFDTSNQRRFIMLIKLNSPQIGNISGENARIVWLDTYSQLRNYLHSL